MADSTSELIARIERVEFAIQKMAIQQGDMGLLSMDLTVQQLRVLMILMATGDRSAHELAEAVGVGATTLTGIVDRLESRELVTRKPDASDRRVRLIGLTTSGKRLVNDTHEQHKRKKRRLLRRLDDRILANLAEALEAVAELIDAEANGVDGAPHSVDKTRR